MQRRHFLQAAGLAGLGPLMIAPGVSWAAGGPGYRNLLVMVELKGGNDGLNTVVPFGDPAYAALRPRIGIKRDTLMQLDEKTGLHPALAPLMPLWEARELAVIQGLGYPQPNLSHFRSIEIWDTASRSSQYLQEGWLTRAFALQPPPKDFSADGVVVGSQELGPLMGGARAVALASTDQFLGNARLASPSATRSNPVLAHVLKVEGDIVQAADGLRPRNGRVEMKTEIQRGGFGDSVRTAVQVVANGEATGHPVAMLRLSLGSFDTHQAQQGTHAALLKQLAEGLVALRASLQELGMWDRTTVMTYAEFGRRPKENLSAGTDHGTVAPHFMLGGMVKGGLYGATPDLSKLDGSGNLPWQVDFRSVYATLLENLWGVDSAGVLGGRFAPLDLIKT